MRLIIIFDNSMIKILKKYIKQLFFKREASKKWKKKKKNIE